jgi:Rrf2 family protein
MVFPAIPARLILGLTALFNDDMLINVSRKVLAMLLSRASRLAVEVLVELTGHASREWMNAAELGRRIGANLPFMKQVLNRLRRAGLVRARPGRSGGYQLARSWQTLSLSAVTQAIDGRDVRQHFLFDSTPCDGTKACRLSPTWHSIRDALIGLLETGTIHSIAERSRSRVDRSELSDLVQSADH